MGTWCPPSPATNVPSVPGEGSLSPSPETVEGSLGERPETACRSSHDKADRWLCVAARWWPAVPGESNDPPSHGCAYPKGSSTRSNAKRINFWSSKSFRRNVLRSTASRDGDDRINDFGFSGVLKGRRAIDQQTLAGSSGGGFGHFYTHTIHTQKGMSMHLERVVIAFLLSLSLSCSEHFLTRAAAQPHRQDAASKAD